MISRRAFLSALAAVPFVGKLIPQQTVLTAADIAASTTVTVYPGSTGARPLIPMVTTGRGYIRVGGEFYKVDAQALHDAMMKLKYDTMWVHRPRLTFAEWDRKYQG